ncbi:MAG: transposase [bacterium]
MPRQPRIDLPGYLYHLITRGIERKPIFKDQHDYESFTSKLGNVLAESNGKCFAWVCMPNQVHMLIRSGNAGLADMMRSLLTGYALYFNNRHRRSGHLFQNRYKSTLCDGDAYLKALVRYIHLNPIKANLVKNIDTLDNFS